jgi:hypothetical protein
MPRLLDVLTLPPRASAGYRKRASLDLLWTRRYVEVRGERLSRAVFGVGDVDQLWVSRALYVKQQPWWRFGQAPTEHWLHVRWSARRNRQPICLGAQVADPDDLEGLPWLGADECVPTLEADLRALLPCLRALGGVARTSWPDGCWQPPSRPLRRRFDDADTAEKDALRALAARSQDHADPLRLHAPAVMLRDQAFPSLSDAIDAASAGDTLRLLTADYLLPMSLTLTKPLNIIGDGPAYTRLIGSASPCVLRVEGPARLQMKGVAVVLLHDDPADILQARAGAHIDLEHCHLIGALSDPLADPFDTDPLGCGARFESGVTGSVRGCRFLDNARHGALLDDDASLTLIRNRAERNGLDGIHAAALSRPQLTANTCRHNARHGLALLADASPLGPITQGQHTHNLACGVFISGAPRPAPISLEDCACEHNGEAGLLITQGAAATASRLLSTDNHGPGARVAQRAALDLSHSRTQRNAHSGVVISGAARASLTQHQSSHNAAHGVEATARAVLDLRDSLLTRNQGCGVSADDHARLHLSGGCRIEANAADGLRSGALHPGHDAPRDASHDASHDAPLRIEGDCHSDMNGGFGFSFRHGHVEGARASQNRAGGFSISSPAADAPSQSASAEASAETSRATDAAQGPMSTLSRVEAHQHARGPGLRVGGCARARVEGAVCEANAVGALVEEGAAVTVEGLRSERNLGDGLRAQDRATVTASATTCARNGGHGARVWGDAALTWRGGEGRLNEQSGLWVSDRGRAEVADLLIAQNRAAGALLDGHATLSAATSSWDDNLGVGLRACDDAEVTVSDCDVSEHHDHGVLLRGRAQATLQRVRALSNRGDGVRAEDAAHALLLRCEVTRNAGHGVHALGMSRLTIKAGEVSYNDLHGLSLVDSATAHVEASTLAHHRACGGVAADATKAKLIDVRAHHNLGDGWRAQGQAALTASACAFDTNQGHGLALVDAATATVDGCAASANAGNGVDLDADATLNADRLTAHANQGHGVGAFGASLLTLHALDADANQRHGLIVGDRARAKGHDVSAHNHGGDGLSLQSAVAPTLSRVRASFNQGCGVRATLSATLEDVHTTQSGGAAGVVFSGGQPSLTRLHSLRDRVAVLVTLDAAPSLSDLTVEGCVESGVVITDRARARLARVNVSGCKRHGVHISREAQARCHTLRCAFNHVDGLHLCDAASAQVIGLSADSNTRASVCLRDAAALTLDAAPCEPALQDPTARLLIAAPTAPPPSAPTSPPPSPPPTSSAGTS